MKSLRNLWSDRYWPLISILALAFILRIVGVNYRLPFPDNLDEPAFIHGTLQMIHLKTLVPSLHKEAFEPILPYPPYFLYVLLLPFVCIAGFQFLAWHGSAALFESYIIYHLSPYYIAARFVNILIGIVSIYLVYQISLALFKSRVASLASSFLLATSLLYIALSITAKNWIQISFIFLFVLFFLTHQALSKNRRYLYAFIVAGIGMGFSPFCAFALTLILLYYLLFDAKNLQVIKSDAPRLLLYVGIFIVLAVVPWILWHGGSVFLKDATFLKEKSFLGLIESPWSALSIIVYSEPVLLLLFLAGLILLLRHYPRVATLLIVEIVLYAMCFYVLFRFEARFLAPLIPLLALVGGYTVSFLWKSKTTKIVIIILLCVPLLASLRLSYLSIDGDTYVHAAEWVQQNLGAKDSVFTYAFPFRLPMRAAGVAELRSIDPKALGTTDLADEKLDRHDIPNVLDIGPNYRSYFKLLPNYAKNYDYLIFAVNPADTDNFASLTKTGKVVAEFSGQSPEISLADTQFPGSLFDLFRDKLLGLDIVIYKLNKS